MKKKIYALLILFIVVVSSALWAMYNFFGFFKEGNASRYDVSKVKALDNSPLAGKRVIFLGSSVTLGAASMHSSFVEYLEKKDSIIGIKEAVSETTLVDSGNKSYVQRMLNNLDPKEKVDLFVCQLSTNDATKGKPLGVISETMSPDDFDTTTITGAMEFIISYAKETWGCPVVFFTNPKYDDDAYGQMVDRLLELQTKWNIGVINMWDDAEMNNLDSSKRKLYMSDKIHPTKAGYLNWWSPTMEDYLYQYMN